MPDSRAPRPKLVLVAGPTGVGKTGLAVEAAERFGAEIVSADSMQVYRRLDIGTAKPTAEEQARAPHHLIDLIEPDEPFDVAAYLSLARPLIQELDRRGTPILAVGGTGFYLRSLIRGLFVGPGSNPEIRERLREDARSKGLEALHARLAEVDPAAAERIHVNDRVRIVRALEVFELTGRPISAFQAEHGLGEAPYEVLFIALALPREELRARIEARTREMYRAGLVEEMRGLIAAGFPPGLRPLMSIGYKQAAAVIDGRLGPAEAEAETIHQTARYAKRQLTWLRSQPDVAWQGLDQTGSIFEAMARFWKA